MIFTDYYLFEHLPDKSKTRLDCIKSTKSYDVFEGFRNRKNELFIYCSIVPPSFRSNAKRKADMSITHTKNISSVYVPDVKLPYAYGDVQGTMDCICMVFNIDYTMIEVFVARGQKHNSINLWQMFSCGEFEGDISRLRASAVDELDYCLRV